jgi:hypothetical protein
MNLTNYSIVVIPVTKADKKIDVFDDSYQPLNPADKLDWEACGTFSMALHLKDSLMNGR